jgi:Leucine-rich repeat (LRR) protein
MKVRPARRPDAVGITTDGKEIEFELNKFCLSCSERNIKSLEIFNKNIRYLFCNDNQLTSLNISNLTNLVYLECYNNQLNILNTSGLTNLQTLEYDEYKTKLIGK